MDESLVNAIHAAFSAERPPARPVTAHRCYPSYDPLQRALRLTEEVAFTPAEFVRWLDRRRPKEVPRLTELPSGATRDGVAAALEGKYRELLSLHGGSCPPTSTGRSKVLPNGVKELPACERSPNKQGVPSRLQ
jgi:hypothetical protein